MTEKTKLIYCSACDREVAIMVRDDQLEGSICMDIGESCTGIMCPICAVEPEVMRSKLTEIEKRPRMVDARGEH